MSSEHLLLLILSLVALAAPALAYYAKPTDALGPTSKHFKAPKSPSGRILSIQHLPPPHKHLPPPFTMPHSPPPPHGHLPPPPPSPPPHEDQPPPQGDPPPPHGDLPPPHRDPPPPQGDPPPPHGDLPPPHRDPPPPQGDPLPPHVDLPLPLGPSATMPSIELSQKLFPGRLHHPPVDASFTNHGHH